jgi:hypothetical protein
MKTIQAESVADGQQPMISADIICKVLYVYQGKAPPREAATTFFEECWYLNKLYQNRHRQRECFENSLL